MATSMLDSLILAHAIQEAWNRAASNFAGDPVRTADAISKNMTELSNRIALMRSIAAQLERESTPEALKIRLDFENQKRLAREKESQTKDARMTDLVLEIENGRRGATDARLADMNRNGAIAVGR